jgi:hypothetical protein
MVRSELTSLDFFAVSWLLARHLNSLHRERWHVVIDRGTFSRKNSHDLCAHEHLRLVVGGREICGAQVARGACRALGAAYASPVSMPFSSSITRRASKPSRARGLP